MPPPAASARAAAPWVTGDVWVDELASPAAPSRLRVDSVHFAPGARTAWHRHPLGQLLHVTAGTGRVQCAGGPVRTIRAGDTVRIGAGEWHWHGAGPDTAMTHLAVQEVAEDGTAAELGEPVDDATYATYATYAMHAAFAAEPSCP
ncbi:(R)-mandelonitrile lyase [Streptomyces huiliensis]|uniref:(R)-mandelonitrile lyase n=1 Tax=Streptomyces huiliensis TaxID=2876027 RepID=UPI001CBB762A|nr:cupin domain-containing protein [Streptomyces huiliensis]MBZ4320744.1 cupin domain-containing protein [Streptomyces huiliensis]